MLGFILISQNGRAVRTYGNVGGRSQTTSKMKLSHLCLLVLVSASVNLAADLDFYPDIAPEDYFIEQLANSIQASQLHRRHPEPEPELELDPESDPESDQEFSFQFPPGAEKETTQFAVRPADPRYYHDTRATPPEKTADNNVAIPKPSVRQSPVEDNNTFQLPRPVNVTPAPPPSRIDEDVEYDQQTADYGGARDAKLRAQVVQTPVHGPDDKTDIYFIAIVAGCSAAAVVGVIVIGVSWYKLQKNAKLAADVEYPAYGVTGPNKDTSPTGDRKLAHSAQMYHYQHQKQQIIAMERESQVANERNGSVSEAESDEENEEGDYTVYECPGLAPTGEMEVKNPLFQDDPTPATPAPANQKQESTSGDVTNTKK